MAKKTIVQNQIYFCKMQQIFSIQNLASPRNAEEERAVDVGRVSTVVGQ